MPPPKERRSQQERSTATRAALLAAGRSLFAEHGYDRVSAEQVAAAAGVTRGAMYHHHRDKRDLFRAVVEDLEGEVTAHLHASVDAAPDTRTAMLTALGGYLDLCRRPDVARILLLDAPGVLGWQEWREIETRHGLGLVTRLLGPAGSPLLAQLVFGTAVEAALIIAHSDDPAAARGDAERALITLLVPLLPPDQRSDQRSS